MTAKQKAGCAFGILGLCISTPMWWWLLYQIMLRVNATETMWLVFYVYIPFSFVILLAMKIIESVFDE